MNEAGEAFYAKFPAVLKKKLKDKEIVFPPDTQFEYDPIEAYRAINRNVSDNTAPNRKDFRSHAERKLRGYDSTKAEYYGVSFFKNMELVENMLHVSTNPQKKVMRGKINKDGGPCLVNDETLHVCWWIFENVSFAEFEIV